MRPLHLLKIITRIFLICLINCAYCENNSYQFPDDFLFGVASSAYQIEGGHDSQGKGANMYDYYTKHRPEKFHNASNGDVACDSFNNWKTDVKLLKALGVHFYRFSISWSRILPDGHAGNINEDGLKYYDSLISELLEKGIEPVVTMYHWDLPMPLANLGGWTNPFIAYYFEDYARVLFTHFGDRVRYWITMNTFGCSGYGDDVFPPFINQSGTADYLCNHVVLLSHAKAYHLYDDEFRSSQHGRVGITVDGRWYEPYSSSKKDLEATERARQFKVGLVANPIFHPDGDYPKIVRDRVDQLSQKEGFVSSRLPIFSPEEKDYVQGTFDFIGLNVYTSYLVKDLPESTFEEISSSRDARVGLYQKEEWPKSNSNWLRVVPSTMRNVLKWFKQNYDDPEIFITENGYSDKGQIHDIERIEYYQGYLNSLLESIHEDGVNVIGYAAWSLLDNFEWTSGYEEKFGLFHVDFKDPERRRTPKYSAKWYKKVVNERRVIKLEEMREIHNSRLKGDL